MLLGENNFHSIHAIVEDIRENKGIDAVKAWCNDFGIDNKYCKECTTKTPILQSINKSVCVVCGTKYEV